MVDQSSGFKHARVDGPATRKEKQNWKPPEPGQAKLNVDGAYSDDGAGAGMALRDDKGDVIFVSCRQLLRCRDATEAELMAIEEGVRLALH